MDLDDPVAVPALIKTSEDEYREVRLLASAALVQIGYNRAVESLIERLTFKENFAKVQLVAIIGLGDLGDRGATQPFMRVLEIGDSTFR